MVAVKKEMLRLFKGGYVFDWGMFINEEKISSGGVISDRDCVVNGALIAVGINSTSPAISAREIYKFFRFWDGCYQRLVPKNFCIIKMMGLNGNTIRVPCLIFGKRFTTPKVMYGVMFNGCNTAWVYSDRVEPMTIKDITSLQGCAITNMLTWYDECATKDMFKNEIEDDCDYVINNPTFKTSKGE